MNGAHVEDRGKYSKVTIYLDNASRYKLNVDGDRGIVVEIEDHISHSIVPAMYKSRLVRDLNITKNNKGMTLVKISLYQKAYKISDFFLKSPPQIVVNIMAKEGVNSIPESKQITIDDEKIELKKSVVTDSEEKEPEDPPFENFEGFEDLISPSLGQFVEIFDTEKSLAVYNILLPPAEATSDYPEILHSSGDYKLKEPKLRSAAQSLNDGDYNKAIQTLKKEAPDLKGMEEFDFLMADAIFQKGMTEGGISNAIDLYMDLLKRHPDSRHAPWAHMQLGRGDLKLQSFAGAADAFKTVINNFEDSPYSLEARLYLARTISEEGKRGEALQLYKDFINNYPSSPFMAEAVFSAAENMANLGRHRKAKLLFEEGLKRWPDYHLRSPESLMMIGESHYIMKGFKDALRYFNRLVNLYPKYRQSDRAMGRIGDIYLHLGNSNGAKKVYTEIEAMYPGSDGAITGMIRLADLLASENGDIDEVMKLYQGVYDRYMENPLSEVATLKAALFLNSHDRDMEAFELLSSFLVIYPKSRLGKKVLGESRKIFSNILKKRYEAGNCLELINLARENERLTVTLKERDKARLWNGNCLFRYGQYNEAAQIYAKVRAGYEHEEGLYMEGRARYLSGDLDKSIEVMKEFRKAFPASKKDKEIRYLLARAYEKTGALERAADFFRSYIKLEGNEALRRKALISLGDILRKISRPLEAVKSYEELIKSPSMESSKELSDAYFLLGEALFDAMLFRKALNAYKTAIGHSPEKLFEEAEYKTALCSAKLGQNNESNNTLKSLSEKSDDSFWNTISSEKLEDVRWRVTHYGH